MAKNMKDMVIESVFIGAAIGTIYRMAPGNKPRKVDEIVNDIHNYFVANGQKCMGSYDIKFEHKDRYDLVEKIMRSSKAFIELNLSQDEFDRNISVDDDSRPKFGFVGRDFGPEEYYDFIDLDACIRNINESLFWDWLDNELFNNRAKIVYDDTAAGEVIDDIDHLKVN